MHADTYKCTHTSISRVHGDEHRASWVELDLCPFKEKHRGTRVDASLDGQDLLCHHRKNFKVNAVELIKARPRPT